MLDSKSIRTMYLNILTLLLANGNRLSSVGFFGMNNIAGRKGKSEYNWTWFESIGEKYDDNTVFFFSERYSQVNGKSYKGANESWNAEQTINRRMVAIA